MCQLGQGPGCHLDPMLDGADVRALVTATVQVPGMDQTPLRAHLEGSHRCPHPCLPPTPTNSLVQLGQENIQAPQLLKQLCKGNRASSVQEHHPPPSMTNNEGQGIAH